MSYTKRREASEGNFHDVVSGIKVAGDHLLEGVELNHVFFFHELRNKLYHQINGITIPAENVEAYVKIAVDLLNRLLKVDLSEDVFRPQIERTKKLEQEALYIEVNDIIVLLKKKKEELSLLIISAIESIDPFLALPSFVKSLSELQIAAANKINKWHQINWLNNDEVKTDGEIMDTLPTELIDELLQSAPDALKNFREKFRIKKSSLIRAAAYSETPELLLLLINTTGKLPEFENTLFANINMFLITNPRNPPYFFT